MRVSRLDDCAAERTSWLQEAGWHALRMTAQGENAILPIGFSPGLARESGHDLTESGVVIRAVWPRSRAWATHRTTELSSYQMRPLAEACCVGGFRIFSLEVGVGETRMARAFKVLMDQGFLALAGCCAAQRVNPWILFATSGRLSSYLEMKAQRITVCGLTNRRWFTCRPPRAATAKEWPARGRKGRRQRMLRRWHARLISVGSQTSFSGLEGKSMSLDCLIDGKLAAVQQILEDRADRSVDSVNEF